MMKTLAILLALTASAAATECRPEISAAYRQLTNALTRFEVNATIQHEGVAGWRRIGRARNALRGALVCRQTAYDVWTCTGC